MVQKLKIHTFIVWDGWFPCIMVWTWHVLWWYPQDNHHTTFVNRWIARHHLIILPATFAWICALNCKCYSVACNVITFFAILTSLLREYDTVGIAKWFFHENSWVGQFRHALSKYAKKNIPSWFSFRDIYDRISTIFGQIFKIRILIAVKKISQFQNGKR